MGKDLLKHLKLFGRQIDSKFFVDRFYERMLADEQLAPIFNYDLLHLGGGNVLNLKAALPSNTRVFTLAEAMRGALVLWPD